MKKPLLTLAVGIAVATGLSLWGALVFQQAPQQYANLDIKVQRIDSKTTNLLEIKTGETTFSQTVHKAPTSLLWTGNTLIVQAPGQTINYPLLRRGTGSLQLMLNHSFIEKGPGFSRSSSSGSTRFVQAGETIQL